MSQKFSQRIGKTTIKDILQIDSMDNDLKTGLWNNIMDDFFNTLENSRGYGQTYSDRLEICRKICWDFFKLPLDKIYDPSSCIAYFRNWYFKADWYEIYDFIELLSSIPIANPKDFYDSINHTLQQEISGYRLVDKYIVEITSGEEIQSVEDALNTIEWKSVSTHIDVAIEMLSNRKNPDYRNSIKESISAVESMCAIITGDKSATLGKALAIIENKYKLHESLKKAFSHIYGYTSDEGGIRHKLLEDGVEIGFEEAKFMLVSCSAFINYLKHKTIN